MARKIIAEYVTDSQFQRGILLGIALLLSGLTLSFFHNQPQSVEAIACPYSSTQVRVQTSTSDPWSSHSSIMIGQSIRLGSFHNGTGRFAGDPTNSYSSNLVNVEYLLIDPTGNSQVIDPANPFLLTPTKVGTYTLIGRTRTQPNTQNYFSQTNCQDTASFTVAANTVAPITQTVLAVVYPSPSINPTPTSFPTATPTPAPTVTPSPSPANNPSITTNTQPDCISLSANPTFGGASLTVSFLGKGRDTDGIVRRMNFDFGDSQSQEIDVIGETNKDTTSSVSHTYRSPGTYYASLRVKDNSGQGNEWSSTPDSCKVKIEIQGVVLAATTTQLPKAGANTALTVFYILSFGIGIGLKLLSHKFHAV